MTQEIKNPAPKKGDGHKKPSEIIREFILATTGGNQGAANNMIATIGQMVEQKRSRMIQFGNTVFWATQAGPGVLDVHVFTEEAPQTLVKRMKQAYAWAKSHGFKQITTTLTDPKFTELLKQAGIPYQQTQTTVSNGKQMVPAIKISMEVK